jgi:tetratricopeptide (TPR) repeat protein
VYSAQGRYEAAIASYQAAIDLDPKDAYPHNGLGLVYSAQGRYEAAIASYQTAIVLDPKYAYPKLNLGLIHYIEGEVDAAKSLWREGIDYLENDRWDQSVHTLCILALGERDSGLNTLQTLVNEGLSIGEIKNVLGVAKMMARCPTPPDGIDQVIALLQSALDEAT